MKNKPTLLVDFDGVLHSYRSGWKGATTIPDAPVEGAMHWLAHVIKHYDVRIYSSRSRAWGGRKAMKIWIARHMSRYLLEKSTPDGEDPNDHYYVTTPGGTTYNEAVAHAFIFVKRFLKFPLFKPAAYLTIDDRAVCFRGLFPTVAEMDRFRPWNKGGERAMPMDRPAWMGIDMAATDPAKYMKGDTGRGEQ